MIVEILYFEGCPSHARLLPMVQRLADRAGAELRQRRIETAEEADRERFLGSPTIRVDGRDIEPGSEHRTDYGLKCRLYFASPLGPSALPPEGWIQTALDSPRG